MKQAKTKLRSGEYCFLKVPKGAKMILEGDMPCGNWQLLGVDPTNLTEEEAGEIVEKVTVEIDVPLRSGGPLKYGMFKNYTTDDQFNFACPVATLSLDSLAASLGISKPYCVLKNK